MSAPQRYPMLPGEPPELLVHDEPMQCPYLPEQTARLPLRLPLARYGNQFSAGVDEAAWMTFKPA